MAVSHTEELVFATTEDGLHLAGLALRPAETAARSAHPVGIVLIHGNAASFSAPTSGSWVAVATVAR